MECIERNNTHTVFFILPDDSKEFNCPYILAVPHDYEENTPIILESNNQEETMRIVSSAKEQTLDFLFATLVNSKNNNPILIPLLPSMQQRIPYYQQLSIECFDESEKSKFYKIDEQVVSMIDDAKRIVTGLTGKTVNSKVFLNGYSSSGVFAQRFALLHPELVSHACIGGAIGSMPLPIDEYSGCALGYPLGTADYEKLTGRKFDLEAYKSIKFTYYVAEGENVRKSETRFDEDGKPAPMCDMSYFDRSMPAQAGKTLRGLFGHDSFERFGKQLMVAESLGLNITYHEPIPNVDHHNINGANIPYIASCITECNKEATTKTIGGKK